MALSRPVPGAPLRPLVALLAAALLAGCGAGGDGAGSSLASPTPVAASATPSPSVAPSDASPTPATSPSSSGAASDAPTPDAFWTAVLAAANAAGHLVATGTGAGPAIVRFLPTASEALVDGELVSRCVGGTSYASAGAELVPLDGAWTCGFAALVAGMRNTGQPIDAWSADFPTAEAAERIELDAGGRWRWELTSDGLDGGGTASLLVDPATGRILEARLTDDAGETVWGFDYERPVAAIGAP